VENVIAGRHSHDVFICEVFNTDRARCLLLLRLLAVVALLFGRVTCDSAESGLSDLGVCVRFAIGPDQAPADQTTHLCNFEHLLLLVIPDFLDVLSTHTLTDLNRGDDYPRDEESNGQESD